MGLLNRNLADCQERGMIVGIKDRFRTSNPPKLMHKTSLCAVLLSFTPLLHADVDQTKPLDLKYTAVDGFVG